MKVFWAITVNVYETFRSNWPIRRRERADQRELQGDALIQAIAEATR